MKYKRKKTTLTALIAAALMLGAAGIAAAEAAPDYKFYGMLDVWGGVQRFPGNHAEGLISDGGMSTSYWGFSAQDELAEGYKAVVKVEGFLRPAKGEYGRFDGDSFFSRNAYAGIESPYGTLTAGRVTTSLFVSTILFNPFVDSYVFSPMVAHTYLGLGTYPSYLTDQGVVGDSGWNSAVQYASPDFHGLSGSATYAVGGSSRQGKKASAQLLYMHGNVGATLVYQRVNYNSDPLDLASLVPGMTAQTVLQAGFSYDWQVVKLYAQYMLTQNDRQQSLGGNWKVNTGQIGATVPIGKGHAMASYARSSESRGLNQGRDTWALGYDYPLSKRTDIYAAYMQDRFNDQSTGYTYGAGLRVNFD